MATDFILSSPTPIKTCGLFTSLIAAFVFLACFNRNIDAGELKGHRKLLSLRQYIDPATTIIKDTHAGTKAGYVPIDLNPNSTIFADIEWILHNPTLTNGVCIRFKHKSRCPHPSLVGRLYGKSITMLDWKKVHSIDGYTAYCGSYEHSWLDSGTYFLEILIIHCNGFGPTSLDKIRSNPKHKGLGLLHWGSFDYTNECLEDPERNRITGNNAYITIVRNLEGVSNRHIGRWVQMDSSQFYPSGIPHQQYTRYQPQRFGKGHYLHAINNTRIESQFSFVWNQDQSWIKDLQKYSFDFGENFMAKQLPEPGSAEFHKALNEIGFKLDEPKICIMGDSHSRILWMAMFRINLGHRFYQTSKCLFAMRSIIIDLASKLTFEYFCSLRTC